MPHPGQGAYADEARAALGATATSGELYGWILENKAGSPGVDAANGIISGQPGDPEAIFDVIVPSNQDEDTVDGWEVNLQHNFGGSGFGVIANATFVDSKTSYDDMLLEQQFVVSGISDSANLIGFYEKHGFSIRIAYNWRDKFLAGTGQANVGGIPPTYVDEYDQIDIGASYTFGDNLQIFLDAINITDETTFVLAERLARCCSQRSRVRDITWDCATPSNEGYLRYTEGPLDRRAALFVYLLMSNKWLRVVR